MMIGTWRNSGRVAESRNPWKKSETSHPSTRRTVALVVPFLLIGLLLNAADVASARDVRSLTAIEIPPDQYGGDHVHRTGSAGTGMQWRCRSPSRCRQRPRR